MGGEESVSELRSEILLLRREISKLLQIALSEFADAERWRYARQHSYIEVKCDSPRVDGWSAELLDQAIDQARISPVEPVEPLVWLLPNDPPLVYTPATLNQDWDEPAPPVQSTTQVRLVNYGADGPAPRVAK